MSENQASEKPIIVLGSGHLAFRVRSLLEKNKLPVVPVNTAFMHGHGEGQTQNSLFDRCKDALRNAGIGEAGAIYVLDEEDRHNLELSLAVVSLNETVPVFVALFNEHLIPHLQANHKNITVKNPAQIAAPAFIAELHHKERQVLNSSGQDMPAVARHISVDKWLYAFIFIFIALFAVGVVFFRHSEHLSWLDSFYFTVTLVTTTGFGDINLLHSGAAAKIFGSLLMLSALISASVTFSLLVDALVRRRSEISLGRRKYHLKGHVIVCGLGRAGYQIAEELVRRGEKILVIESDPDNKFLEVVRMQGVPVLVGDAALEKNLQYAGVQRAKAVMSVVNDDLKNIEISLAARTLRHNLRLIVRIFDDQVAEAVTKQFGIGSILSTSAIAAKEFVHLLGK